MSKIESNFISKGLSNSFLQYRLLVEEDLQSNILYDNLFTLEIMYTVPV